METSNARVTARLHRTEAGEVHQQYVVGETVYGSVEELQAALGAT